MQKWLNGSSGLLILLEAVCRIPAFCLQRQLIICCLILKFWEGEVQVPRDNCMLCLVINCCHYVIQMDSVTYFQSCLHSQLWFTSVARIFLFFNDVKIAFSEMTCKVILAQFLFCFVFVPQLGHLLHLLDMCLRFFFSF